MIHQFISAEPKRPRSLPNLSKEAKQEFIAILSINSLFVLKMNNTVNWDGTRSQLWAEYTTNSTKYPNIHNFLVECSNDKTISFSLRQVFDRKMYNVFSASKKKPRMNQITTAAVNSATAAAAAAVAMPPPVPRTKKKNTKTCPDCNALYGNAKQKCDKCGHDFRKDPKSKAAQRGDKQRAQAKQRAQQRASSVSSSVRAPSAGFFTDSESDSDSDDDDTGDIWLQICRVASKSREFYINISNYLKDKKFVFDWQWQIVFGSPQPYRYVTYAFVRWADFSNLPEIETWTDIIKDGLISKDRRGKMAAKLKEKLIQVLDKYTIMWIPQLKPPPIGRGGASKKNSSSSSSGASSVPSGGGGVSSSSSSGASSGASSVPSGRGGASSSSSSSSSSGASSVPSGGGGVSSSSSSSSSSVPSGGASSSSSSSSSSGASSVPSGGGIKLPLTPKTAKQYFNVALWNYFIYILQQGELGDLSAQTSALNVRENLSNSRKNWQEFSRFVFRGIQTYDIPISNLRKDGTKTLTFYSKIDPFIAKVQDIHGKTHILADKIIVSGQFKKAIEWALKNNYVLPPPPASQRQPRRASVPPQRGASKRGGLSSQSSQRASVPAKAITLNQYNVLKLAIDKHITNKEPGRLNLKIFQLLFGNREFQKDSNLPADILNHPKFVDYMYNLAVEHMYTRWLWKDDDDSFKLVDKNNSMVINHGNIHRTDAQIILPNGHQVNIIYCNEDVAIQDGSSWYRYFCRRTLPPSKRYKKENVRAPGHDADQVVQNQELKDAKKLYLMVVDSSSSSSSGGATKSASSSSSDVSTSCPTTFTARKGLGAISCLISEYTPLNTIINVWITTPVPLYGQYVYYGFYNNKPMWINNKKPHVYIVYHNDRYIIARNGQILYKCEKRPGPNEPVLSNVGWKRTQAAASMEEDIIVYYENVSGDGPCSINDLYLQTCNSPHLTMPVWGDVNKADLIQFRQQPTKYNWTLVNQRVSCRNARVPRLISREIYNRIFKYRQWIGDSQGFPTTASGPAGPKIAGTWSWELPKVLKDGIPPDDWFDNIQNKDLYSANLGSADQEFFDRFGKRHAFVGFFQPHKIKTTTRTTRESNGTRTRGISPKEYFSEMMWNMEGWKTVNELNKPRMSIIYHATKSADVYRKIVLGDFKTMADAATARLYGNGVYAAIHPYINYCMGGVANNKVTYASGLGPKKQYYVVIVANAVARPSYQTSGGTWVQPESGNFFTGGSIGDNLLNSEGKTVRPLPLSLDNREVVFFQTSASNWSHIIGLAVFAINH